MPDETIFTKIVKREIPATIVYEDDAVLAFLDIHPVVKGHTLLISKAVYQWIEEVPDELVSALFLKTKELIKIMKKNLPCDYVQISVVGKDVPHVHIHLIPRHFDDGLHGWPTLTYEEGEMERYAEKIRQ